MRTTGLMHVATLLPLLLAAQQVQIDDARWQEIVAKHKRGDQITEEERDYYETKIERRNQAESAKRNAEWAKAHPARESTGLVPLPDLGADMYQGEQGGLY